MAVNSSREQIFDHLDEPLTGLERDVAGEPITDDHIGRSAVHLARLDIAVERQRRRLQQPVRLARQFIALGFFFADRQQRDPRPLDAERHPRIHAAHHRELQQVMRTALDACPDIEQQRRTAPGRDGRAQRRPVDAGEHAERAVRRHHRRAGMTGAEQCRGITRGGQFGGHPDRRARLAPQRRGRRLGHLDDRIGADDPHPRGIGIRIPGDFVFQSRDGANENHAEIEVSGRRERSGDDVSGRFVPAHRINGDPNHERNRRFWTLRGRCRRSALLLGDGPHLPAAVVAAVRADAMRRLGLVAMRALAEADGLQRVVGPALGRAGL